MIYIKDKGNRTQVFIPRGGNLQIDYVTNADLELINIRLSAIEKEYATKVYVDDIVGEVNNELEEILN